MSDIDYCKTWGGYFMCPLGLGIAQGGLQALPSMSSWVQSAQSIIGETGKFFSMDDAGSVLGNQINNGASQFFDKVNLSDIFTKGGAEFGNAGNLGTKSLLERLNLPELFLGFVQDLEKAVKKSSSTIEQIGRDQIDMLGRWAGQATRNFLPWVALSVITTVAIPYGVKYVYQVAEKNLSKPKLASEVKNNHLMSRIFDATFSTVSNLYKVGVPSTYLMMYTKWAGMSLPTLVKMYPHSEAFMPSSVIKFIKGIDFEISNLREWGINPLGFAFPSLKSLSPQGLSFPGSYGQSLSCSNLGRVDQIAFAVGAAFACYKTYQLYQDYVKSIKEEPKAIFNEELTQVINDLTQATYNIQKNKGYFQNVLLYGPGGTGKTMIAKIIAKNSNMNYVMMSGGTLAQHIKNGDHVTELNNLMDRAKQSSTPTILFIDEAESLAKNRDLLTSIAHLELQNAFLNHTGESSQKLMVILATNRMKDLDEAILSRMDHKLHINPPEVQERKKILDQYILKFFKDSKERQAIFSEQKVQEMAEKTENFTGRTLFKLLNAIAGKKSASKDNRLTSQMVDSTLNRFIQQEQEVLELRAQKKKEVPVIEATPIVEVKKPIYIRLSDFATRLFKSFKQSIPQVSYSLFKKVHSP